MLLKNMWQLGEKYTSSTNSFLYLKIFRHCLRPKLTLIMKLITIFFFTFLLQVQAHSFSKKVTLAANSMPLERAFKKVSAPTRDERSVQYDLLQTAAWVSVNNLPGAETFDEVLREKKPDYFIAVKTPAIKARATGVAKTNAVINKRLDIEGTVYSESGTPLAGATVHVKGRAPVYTNVAGKFVLKGVAENTMIKITYLGCKDAELSASAIRARGKIVLRTDVQIMDETVIRSKKPAGAKVDLKYRQHLNLSQVLQGTVPGLVIKSERKVSETVLYDTRKITALQTNFGFKNGLYTAEQFRLAWNEYAGTQSGGIAVVTYDESAWAQFLRQRDSDWSSTGAIVRNQSYSNEALVPELRGAGSFPGATQSMLIVIDGFVQKDFPADYPMNNVANIEVVRDPAETIKWGPEALNGVILITTNRGASNRLDISYNNNISFSGPRDNTRAALRLPNSAQVLDFYMEASNRRLLDFGTTNRPPATNPARTLLYQKEYGTVAQKQAFQRKWDSLANINEDVSRQLQQNIFQQNHNLRFAGSINDIYRYNINGIYGTSQTEALGNKNRRLGINMSNQFSLLKNKLQINWLLNATNNKAISGTAFQINRLEPYQKLYNPDGSYVYDFTQSLIGEDYNAELLAEGLGYVNSGANPLEDALLNRNTTRTNSLNTQLGIDWRLLPELNFAAALLYDNNRTRIEDFKDQGSSDVRRMYNTYGAYDIGDNTTTFFLPFGNIMSNNTNELENINVRTGLTFQKRLMEKHAVEAALGVAAFNGRNNFIPQLPIYGYNPSTGTGIQPIVPITGRRYFDYFGFEMYPNQLAVNQIAENRQQQRNLSVNSRFNYTYDERYKLDSYYNQSFMPVNTQDLYTSTSNANAMASWLIHKENFFNIPYISKLKLSVGAGQIQMAKLPIEIMASRRQYPEWDVQAITISGYNAVRQNGERIKNYDALFDMGLSENRFQVQLNYRRNSEGVRNQFSGRISYDISSEPYFKVPFISTLFAEAVMTNISPGQAVAQMMGTNSPNAGGGFMVTTGNMSLGLLPPHVVNKELHLNVGFFKDRLLLDLRHYSRLTSGLGNGFVAADPTTGFSSQNRYSEIVNKGWEMFLKTQLIKEKSFSWSATINGSYNVNLAQSLPKVNFINDPSYLTVGREGYATDNVWSYKWAGLNELGQPRVYNEKGEAIVGGSNVTAWNSSNDSWLEYSGRTTAPWNVALLQDITYKGLFARVTILSAYGNVMRKYMPVVSTTLDNSVLIANRWRNPGDEKITDIARMENNDGLRSMTIKYSNNTILPADFIRLQEVMLGYTLSDQMLKSRYLKNLWVSFQLQNLGLLWAKNKEGIDPGAVAFDGRITPRRPLTYGLSVNLTF